VAEVVSRPPLHGDHRGADDTSMLGNQQRQPGCRHLSVQAVSTDDHFGALFRGTRDAVLVADRTGRCIEANPAAESLLGFERDELLQLHLSDIADGLEAL
jgi:PAS domain-containing protein